MRFLPEDVRLAAAYHPEPPKGKQMIAHLLLTIFLIAMFGGMIYLGIDGLKSGFSFWQMTLRFVVFLYVMKAFEQFLHSFWIGPRGAGIVLRAVGYDACLSTDAYVAHTEFLQFLRFRDYVLRRAHQRLSFQRLYTV